MWPGSNPTPRRSRRRSNSGRWLQKRIAAKYLGAYGFALATTPLLMAQQDQVKYIYNAVDPDQLYDLATDPNEQVNQIDNPEYHEVKTALAELVNNQWDNENLSRDIVDYRFPKE